MERSDRPWFYWMWQRIELYGAIFFVIGLLIYTALPDSTQSIVDELLIWLLRDVLGTVQFTSLILAILVFIAVLLTVGLTLLCLDYATYPLRWATSASKPSVQLDYRLDQSIVGYLLFYGPPAVVLFTGLLPYEIVISSPEPVQSFWEMLDTAAAWDDIVVEGVR